MSFPSLRQPNTTSKSTQSIFQRGKTTTFANMPEVSNLLKILKILKQNLLNHLVKNLVVYPL